MWTRTYSLRPSSSLRLVHGSRGAAVEDSREVVDVEAPAVGQEHGALDQVLELADVPGPGCCLQRGERCGRDALHVLVEAAVELLEEVVDEERDVVGALAQRRERHRARRSSR